MAKHVHILDKHVLLFQSLHQKTDLIKSLSERYSYVNGIQ